MLNYTTLTVGDKEYKLRLTSKKAVELERNLKKPLMNSIEAMQNLSMDTIITILHYSMQSLEHGIKEDDVYNIYDQLVDEGKQLEDFIDIIMDIFEVSGFFKKEQVEEKAQELKKNQESIAQ